MYSISLSIQHVPQAYLQKRARSIASMGESRRTVLKGCLAAIAAGLLCAAPAAPRSHSSAPAGRQAGAGRHWPVAEAGVLLDAMKAKVADITHPWPLIQEPAPDLGGQHLISLYAMRHEVAEGAAHVHGLIAQMTGDPAPASPLVP